MIDKNKMIEVGKNIIKNNGLGAVTKICKDVRCDECVFSCYLSNSKEELVRKAKIYLEDNGVDEMKTEKTFKEVIADIKEGEVWESEKKTITYFNKRIEVTDTCNNVKTMCFHDSMKYKLQKKQYTFTEAFAAYEEGKEIESCISGREWGLNILSFDTFTIEEIRNKWYINN